MVMKMFATLDKGTPVLESKKGLNLVAVTFTIAQVSRLPGGFSHNQERAWSDEGLVYIAYITYAKHEKFK
jgi:hypothetical protein